MKNKKGFLLGEHTLKTIIGVIAVLLLLYLLVVLYSSFTDKTSFKRAEATLESLSEKMLDAKSGTEDVSLPLLEPNSWRLISYPGFEKPEQCIDDCICLCEGIRIRDRWKLFWTDTQLEKCDIRGICKNFGESINNFEIKIRADVEIEYDEGYIITEVE